MAVQLIRISLVLSAFLWLTACGSFPSDSASYKKEQREVERAIAGGQLKMITVFDKRRDLDASGEGFANFRIPALSVSQQGTLLAFVEGRRVRSDHNKGPLVLRRSEDGGKSWGPLQLIVQHGQDSLNNPTPVVLPSGRILVVYQRFPEDFHSRALPHERVAMVRPGLDGDGVQTNHLIYSDDDGVTWSEPLDITAQSKRPAPVMANFSGPGPGLRLQEGPNAGRILLPSCDFTGEGKGREFRSYATYSDDDGITWLMGQQAENPASISADETQLVELKGGKLLMTVRARGQRMLAYSNDGGETFTPLKIQMDLPDSGAMGSAARLQDSALGDVLLHSLSTTRINGRRSRGAVYMSTDEGYNWQGHRVYHPGSFDYSSIALLPDGDIGILGEFDWGVEGKFNEVRFVRVDPQWLLEPLR
ncbi:MAG: sialidase family protein [Halioglobus sp.]